MFKTRYILLDSALCIDLPKLKDKLETLSLEGWIVTKVRTTYLKLNYFHSQPLHYDIKYLPKIDILTYKQLSKEAGWRYMDHHENLFVFCTDEEQQSLPFQIDSTIEQDILISMTLKYHLLPIFLVLLTNSLTHSYVSDFLFLTSYTGNITLFLYHILFPGYSIYLICHLIQILVLKKQTKPNQFNHYFTKSLHFFSQVLFFSLIITFILMFYLLILENNEPYVSFFLLLSLLFLTLMGWQLNGYIKTKTRGRKRNLLSLIGRGLVISFCLAYLVVHGMINPTSKVQSDEKMIKLHELLPQEQLTEVSLNFDFQSSFLISDYYTYSSYGRESYSYQSYQLRSSFFKNYFIKLLLKEYNRHDRYTVLNPNIANSYFIYKRDTNQVSGILLIYGLTTYVIESTKVDFTDRTLVNHLLDLLSS